MTIATEKAVYTGVARKGELEVTADADWNGLPVEHVCRGKKNAATGQLEMHCDIGPGNLDITCDIPLSAEALPANASAVCCDIKAQSCGDKNRCAVVDTDSGHTISACIPAEGTKAEGEECARAPEVENFEYGPDDCGPGLLCRHEAPFLTPLTCHQLCQGQSDCKEDEQCLRVGALSPQGGYCAPRCTPFTDARCSPGTTCIASGGEVIMDDGQTAAPLLCRLSYYFAKVGDPCNISEDCPAATLCMGSSAAGYHCVAMCDGAHPCVNEAESCHSSDDQSIPYGYCYAD